MAGVLGNVSFTEQADSDRSVKKVIAQWYTGSGDNNGTAWGTTTNFFDGHICAAITSTSNTPQNAYNVRVLDAHGTDVMGGALLARTNTADLPQIVTGIYAVSHSQLNIYIANTNFNRNGNVTLFIR